MWENGLYGVWLLTEGKHCCILHWYAYLYCKYIGASTYFGITFQGNDKTGEPSFLGLANSKPLEFELMTSVEI